MQQHMLRDNRLESSSAGKALEVLAVNMFAIGLWWWRRTRASQVSGPREMILPFLTILMRLEQCLVLGILMEERHDHTGGRPERGLGCPWRCSRFTWTSPEQHEPIWPTLSCGTDWMIFKKLISTWVTLWIYFKLDAASVFCGLFLFCFCFCF